MLLFIVDMSTLNLVSHSYFNTTLVTVYRGLLSRRSRVRFSFQYNSCYCLSLAFRSPLHRYKPFQYNSCYCLSIIPLLISVSILISIQLLLLFIGHPYSKRTCLWHFNTTLVTVYPTFLCRFLFLL